MTNPTNQTDTLTDEVIDRLVDDLVNDLTPDELNELITGIREIMADENGPTRKYFEALRAEDTLKAYQGADND